MVLQHHHHGVSTSPHPFLCFYLEEGSDGLCSGEGGLEAPKPQSFGLSKQEVPIQEGN